METIRMNREENVKPMHFHWQNLNEKKRAFGIPYTGRCWWHLDNNRTVRLEWNFWSTFCHAEFEIHDGWKFGLAFPPISLWLCFDGFKLLHRLSPKRESCLTPGLMLTDERECKIAIHSWTLCIIPWGRVMEHNTRDPWWIRGLTFHLNHPWELVHDLTEILDARESRVPISLSTNKNGTCPIVWSDRGKRFMESWDERQKAKDAVSIESPYQYTLRSGTVQERKATIHVIRTTWRRRWMPWFKKVRTSIDVAFDREVGERSGSWKGGCTGCGYEMLPGETMLLCLRRMEQERKLT